MRLRVGLALSMGFFAAFAPACTEATEGTGATDAARDVSDDALYASRSFLWTTKSIPVCFEDASAANATERAWVEDAARTSWSAVSAIDFVGFGACTANARGVRIRTEDVGPYTDGLGNKLDGKPGGMVLNFTFAKWSPGCQKTREFCIRAGAVHELGHALGFAHEQNRSDTPSWCTSEQGLRGDLTIGAWDVDSIMNYCNPKWTGGGRLSRMDILGVQSVYGRTSGEWIAGDDHLATSGHGGGRETPLLADVDGDGRADAVAYDPSGQWWVARSSGADFAQWVLARSDHGGATARPLLGDVTGDGKSDAVAVFADGSWQLATSNGADFASPVVVASGHGAPTTDAFLGDVDGDGKADAVTVDRTSGVWSVARSNGSLFIAGAEWSGSHGRGCTEVFLADVDGDGRADAVAFTEAEGAWWVARSTGTAFAPPTLWTQSHGIGSTARFVVDVDGDRRADAIVYSRRGGDWWTARSVGSAFAKDVHTRGELGLTIKDGMVTPLLADIDGDRHADTLLVWR